MKVKIHNLNGEDAEVYGDCIDYVASRAGLEDAKVVQVLSLFLERAGDNMAVGKVVPLPGFGKLGPWLEERRARQLRYNKGNPYCIPVFVASKGLRKQIKLSAPANSRAKDALKSYRKNSSKTTGPGTNTLMHEEQAKIRASIAKQLGQ